MLILAGVAIYQRRRRLGMRVIIGTFAALYLLSTPWVSYRLAAIAETSPALNPDTLSLDAQAIVVLGGGRRPGAEEFAQSLTVNNSTLARLRYGAFIARRTGLPILVAGGTPFGEGASEAQLMSSVLSREFSVEVRWREDKSLNTEENAAFSAPILLADGVRRVYLVTDALHMRRSVRMFKDAGLDIIPAPTTFKSVAEPLPWLLKIVPDGSALQRSSTVFHEIFGAWWYALRR
ncbi:MAG: YdcF family protein [Gammaproteobacteria bacterium]|nr:YdcF family protein [Gammaproteobacteria bacterium]